MKGELKTTTIGIKYESGHILSYTWSYYMPVESDRWLLYYY